MLENIYSVKQTETHSVYKFFGIKLSVPIHVQEDTQTLIANLEKKYVLHKTIMRKRFWLITDEREDMEF